MLAGVLTLSVDVSLPPAKLLQAVKVLLHCKLTLSVDVSLPPAKLLQAVKVLYHTVSSP